MALGTTFVGMGVSRLTWSHFIPTASLAVGTTFVGMAFGLEKGHFPKTWHPYRHPCAFVGRHLSVFFVSALSSFLLSYTPSSKWAQGDRDPIDKDGFAAEKFSIFIPTTFKRQLSASVCSFTLFRKTSTTDSCWRRGDRNQLSCAFMDKLRMVRICLIFAGLFQGPDSGHRNERNEMLRRVSSAVPF